MTVDLSKYTLDDMADPPPPPEGYYKAIIGNYQARAVGQDGKPIIEFNNTLLSAAGDQDLSGIDLNRAKPKTTLWVNSSDAKEQVLAADPSFPHNLLQGCDGLIGREVFGRLYFKKRGEKMEAVFRWVPESEISRKS